MASPDLDWLKQYPDDVSGLLLKVGTDWGGSDTKTIGVAVSGGGDSMALLHLAVTLRDHMGWDLRAVTVDHGLRHASADEARHVADICASWDVAHDIVHWTDHPETGNLQAQARNARYRLMAKWAMDSGTDRILLGHTQDDIAENFLIRLARKAGVDGLAAMDPHFVRHGLSWTRPLWQVSRAELRHYLKSHDVSWIDDPSNDDPKFTRVQMRQALEILEPLGITTEALSAVSANLKSAKTALDQYALDALQHVEVTDIGDVILPAPSSLTVPPETQRRLMVAALRFVSGRAYGPRQSALDVFEAGLTEEKRTTLHGCVLTRTGDRISRAKLVVSREPQAVLSTKTGLTEMWDTRWALSGPDLQNAEIRALGEGIKECIDWRDTGFSRSSLMASPAIWRANTLISAPLAGFNPQWQAKIVTGIDSYLLSH